MDVKSYVESGRDLQQKYDEIRRGIVTRQNLLQEQYKPLIEPLREISSNLKTQSPSPAVTIVKKREKKELVEKKEKVLTEKDKEFLNIVGPLAYEYLCNTDPSQRDTTFGIYIKDKKPYLGNSPISIENDVISLRGEKYMGTLGLWELLTKKEPENYNNDDLDVYEYLLTKTSAHRHHHDPEGNIKSSAGNKYLKVIKPMLLRHGSDVKKPQPSKSLSDELNDVSGSGLRKILTNAPVEYVYWNDLNELLERLYIVYGEIKSGNTNPTLHNELVNILQEIKEET